MNSITESPAMMAPAVPVEPSGFPGPPAPSQLPIYPAPPSAHSGFTWACPCCHATLRTVSGATRGACPACGSIIEAPVCAPASPPPQPAAPIWKRRPCRASLVKAGLVSLLLTAAIIGFTTSRPWHRSGVAHSSPTQVPPPSTETLRQKLHHFLQARGWPAKRAHVLDATRLEAAGSAYYDGRDPEELAASAFQPWSPPDLPPSPDILTLRAERPNQRPVVAFFRRSGSDWLLDWETFTQTYDEALPQFLAKPAFPIRTFRARLSRVHPASPTPGTCSIQITDILDPSQKVLVDLPLGTPIMHTISAGLATSTSRDATVELSWSLPDPDGPWVPQLQNLVCWGWHGLNGRPELAPEAPPTPGHFISPTAAPLSSPPPPSELALATPPARPNP